MESNSATAFFWKIIKPYKWWYVLMLQAPIIGAFYTTANFYAIKLLIDAFSVSDNIGYSELMFPILLYVGSVIIFEVIWRLRHFAYLKSQPFVRAEILSEVYDYVQHHSYKFFQNTQSGSITSKIKGIVDGYNNLWESLTNEIANEVLMVLVVIISLAFINIQVFIFVSVWAAIFFPIMILMYIKIGRLAELTSNSKHKAIGFIADNISNIFSVFSFASRKRELNKIRTFSMSEVAVRDYKETKYDIKAAIVGGILYAGMIFALLLYMIHLRKLGKISIGDFVYVMTTAFIVVESIWKLSWNIGMFTKRLGDFKSAFQIIKTPQEVIDKQSAKEIKILNGEIEFKDIVFKYEDKNVFNGLNLKIKAGERVGLIGSSGAGKTTLTSILLKNFKVTSGDVFIDGVSIYDVSSDSLRAEISLIPQDIMMFHRSIGQNIGYAKENATQEDIEYAAKQANIHDFIESLPEKYNTLVGERGVKLSGGQRQRIAIARAILKNSNILILDEATSALDSETEQEIQKSINMVLEKSGATVIAIAHRLSTIKHLDRIIVLSEGEIIEDGSFKELIAKNGKFKQIWDSQVNGVFI